MKFPSGVRALSSISQVDHAGENAFEFSVVGSAGTVVWKQEEPDLLRHHARGRETVLQKGTEELAPIVQQHSILPSGHGAGYVGGFVSFYDAVASDLCYRHLNDFTDRNYPTPSIADGVVGASIIRAVVLSHARQRWLNVSYPW